MTKGVKTQKSATFALADGVGKHSMFDDDGNAVGLFEQEAMAMAGENLGGREVGTHYGASGAGDFRVSTVPQAGLGIDAEEYRMIAADVQREQEQLIEESFEAVSAGRPSGGSSPKSPTNRGEWWQGGRIASGFGLGLPGSPSGGPGSRQASNPSAISKQSSAGSDHHVAGDFANKAVDRHEGSAFRQASRDLAEFDGAYYDFDINDVYVDQSSG